ncbi:MAG: class I SAM-dependent methyltransferase [Terrimicrobiaceae bacterium]
MTTHQAARKAAASRYWKWKSLYFYTRSKIAWDPAYRWVAEALVSSPRPLLDIGCGAGQLAAYLRACGHHAPISGMDVDETKILIAQEAVPGCDFAVGDAMALPAHHGDVVMLDVLHYFDPTNRQKLFENLARRIAPDGLGILRVTLKDPSWRYRVTCLEEWFVGASGWIPFRSVGFPDREELDRLAAASGMQARVFPMWGITPFNSYLMTLHRAP